MNTPHEEPRDSANDAIVLAHFSPRFPDVRPREAAREIRAIVAELLVRIES